MFVVQYNQTHTHTQVCCFLNNRTKAQAEHNWLCGLSALAVLLFSSGVAVPVSPSDPSTVPRGSAMPVLANGIW